MSDDYKVATEALYFPGGQLAYGPGDRVEGRLVSKYDWDKQVAGPDSKAAKRALGEEEEKESPRKTGGPGTVAPEK